VGKLVPYDVTYFLFESGRVVQPSGFDPAASCRRVQTSHARLLAWPSVAGPFLSPPGRSGESASTTDPCSWLQIEPGWSVVGADGSLVGSVLSITGDKQDDIFDGLAISLGGSTPARYVPGEQVGSIFPGKVTLRFVGAEADKLELFQEPPPQTVWRPSVPSLISRLSNWMRGKR
jgi:hypothetical protein